MSSNSSGGRCHSGQSRRSQATPEVRQELFHPSLSAACSLSSLIWCEAGIRSTAHTLILHADHTAVSSRVHATPLRCGLSETGKVPTVLHRVNVLHCVDSAAAAAAATSAAAAAAVLCTALRVAHVLAPWVAPRLIPAVFATAFRVGGAPAPEPGRGPSTGLSEHECDYIYIYDTFGSFFPRTLHLPALLCSI